MTATAWAIAGWTTAAIFLALYVIVARTNADVTRELTTERAKSADYKRARDRALQDLGIERAKHRGGVVLPFVGRRG